jgi:hypothetical protein
MKNTIEKLLKNIEFNLQLNKSRGMKLKTIYVLKKRGEQASPSESPKPGLIF